MFVERKKRESAIGGVPGVDKRGPSSSKALMPFLTGVVIGLAISTLAVVRPSQSPAAGPITNIYISLGKSTLADIKLYFADIILLYIK